MLPSRTQVTALADPEEPDPRTNKDGPDSRSRVKGPFVMSEAARDIFGAGPSDAINERPGMADEPLVLPTPEASLYATYFGAFAVYRAGRPLPLGRTRAVQELCRYLFDHAGQTVSCEQLVELLWPDADAGRAQHRLHVAISSLRAIVGKQGGSRSVVSFEGDSYGIVAGAVLTDCDLFDRHHRRAGC
jgi:hypothetical protein